MGHERNATILADILSGIPDAEIVKTSGSELFDSANLKMVSALWNYLIRRNRIRTADIVMNFLMRIFLLPVGEVLEIDHCLKKLDGVSPDFIISTSDASNKVLATYAKEKNIPFFIFLSEISTFIDLVNPYALHLCCLPETAKAIRNYDMGEAYFAHPLGRSASWFSKIFYVSKVWSEYALRPRKHSIYRNGSPCLPERNRNRVEVIGPLAERKYFAAKNRGLLRERFGILPNVPAVAVVSGSIGGSLLTDTVRQLCRRFPGPLHVMVICGRDESARLAIESFAVPAHIRVQAFGFVNNLDEYLRAVDCVVIRPSASVFIESLFSGTPILAVGKVPSNDRGSISTIDLYELGKSCEDPRHVADTLIAMLERLDMYRQNIRSLLASFPATYEERADHLRQLVLDQMIRS
ncbi:hypothetical protein SD70_28780 [Gordoniibacillus kamchatkensis]|uniref:Glycosyl transferase family 28 C-terminal domain-containing protein n=2 Tax=Gordoniibacillus kamchatkensis TaxID=1590651 RepID=A0ABR5AAM4_9BACL|nr:hypothetical protein SD70_28780 [Paenibacillus sp. VKM B-2647]